MATSTLAARTSRAPPAGVGGDHAAAAAALDDQVEGERALVAPPATVGPHGVDERALDLGAGGRAAGVHDPRQRVAALAGELELALGVAVEGGAERDELVDARRALVDEHAHGVDVAQPGAGGERVGEVEVGRVGVAAEHRGHAALGPARRGLLELALGEHADPHAVDLGGPHRGRQPGHAGAEHEQVEVGHRQGLARPEGPGPDR